MFSDTRDGGKSTAICVPNTGKTTEEGARPWENTRVTGSRRCSPADVPRARISRAQSPLGVHRPEPHSRGLDVTLKVHTGVHESVPPSRGDPEGAEATPLGWAGRRGSGHFLNPRGSLQSPLQPDPCWVRNGQGWGLRCPVPSCADGGDQPAGAPVTADTVFPLLGRPEAGDTFALGAVADVATTQNSCRHRVSVARDELSHALCPLDPGTLAGWWDKRDYPTLHVREVRQHVQGHPGSWCSSQDPREAPAPRPAGPRHSGCCPLPRNTSKLQTLKFKVLQEKQPEPYGRPLQDRGGNCLTPAV